MKTTSDVLTRTAVCDGTNDLLYERKPCFLCGKPFKPEHALDAICWPCIVRRAA